LDKAGETQVNNISIVIRRDSVGIDQGPNDGDGGHALVVVVVVVVMGRKVSVTNV